MNKEMGLMHDFDVYDEVPIQNLDPHIVEEALDFTWVHKWKGIEVRSRLCARGFKQWIRDLDSVFASTPAFLILKILNV